MIKKAFCMLSIVSVSLWAFIEIIYDFYISYIYIIMYNSYVFYIFIKNTYI